jgi:methylenetetrahydrofolate dehydrogenase (NADP+)/methenyltetrahydrofolate cyclohydrolase
MILDGKQLAATLQSELRAEVADFRALRGVTPVLAAVLVGSDPASEVYVRNKRRACERAGIGGRLVRLPDSASTAQLLDTVGRLNADPDVHGILVQLPLPRGVDSVAVLDAIDPARDVDGFHPLNSGLMLQGRPRLLPCTPLGVLVLLQRYQLPVAGRHVCIVGRSDIVGKPLAALLVQRTGPCGPDYANATVTLCHSQSHDLAAITRAADVLVAAIGQPRKIDATMVKPGAVVIDVGINRTAGGLVGDVDFDSVARIVRAITPVPGGVGPMTVAMLLANTLTAARRQTDGLAGS